MKKVKIIALVLIASMLFPVLIGCSKPIGSGTKDTSVVLKCGDKDITRDEYNYFYSNYKKDDPSLSEEELYDLSINAIKKNVALEQLASEWKVEFTDEDEEELDEYVQNAINNESSADGTTQYYSNLENSNLTGDLFRYLYKMQIMEKKLRDYAYAEQNGIIKSDDATLNQAILDDFYAAQHILITTDTGKDDEQSKALANTILLKALAGEDFDELAREYSEDQSLDSSYVYYFTSGQMLEEFEKAAKNTTVGEIYPEVVKSPAGYHIIKRLPLDQNEIDTRYEDLRYYYKCKCFNYILEAKMNMLEVRKQENF